MTRKHIESIAAAIRVLLNERPTSDERLAIHATARTVAHALSKLNPSFDEARFLRDCGVS